MSPAPDGGTVIFTDGNTPIPGCGAVSVDANGKATCGTTPLGVGPHQIAASYSGTDAFSASDNTMTQTLNRASTTTTLLETLNLTGGAMTAVYTATVTVNAPGAGDPSGTVAFKVGNTVVSGCAAQPVDPNTGKATCTVSSLNSAGFVTASYSGDDGFLPSSANMVTSVHFQLPGLFRRF